MGGVFAFRGQGDHVGAVPVQHRGDGTGDAGSRRDQRGVGAPDVVAEGDAAPGVPQYLPDRRVAVFQIGGDAREGAAQGLRSGVGQSGGVEQTGDRLLQIDGTASVPIREHELVMVAGQVVQERDDGFPDGARAPSGLRLGQTQTRTGGVDFRPTKGDDFLDAASGERDEAQSGDGGGARFLGRAEGGASLPRSSGESTRSRGSPRRVSTP